jgi:WD40 repeat protein
VQNPAASPVRFAEKAHLLSAYTSAAFCPSSASAAEDTDASPSLVALGTESGVVVVWDTSTAEVRARLGARGGKSPAKGAPGGPSGAGSGSGSSSAAASHGTPVRGLAWATASDGSARLYSCAEGSPTVLEWSLSSPSPLRALTGDKRGVSRVAATSDGATLFAAASDVRVIDLASGSVARKLQGHAAPVTGISLSSDDVSRAEEPLPAICG